MSALEALDLTGKGLNAFSVLLTLKRRLFQLSNLSKKCAFSTFFVFFPVQCQSELRIFEAEDNSILVLLSALYKHSVHF
jgi:hypothetical protein